ncbi:MAG: hypothetical protein MJZ12_01365 [Prevotella sp.]|nr:hypothetical protein [Prevotella sp.]
MKQITINVVKSAVYNEVAKTTSYAGAKKVGDEGAYDRIFTTDEDQEMLERFWKEAASGATDTLKKWISENEEGDEYRLLLHVADGYDIGLTSSIETSLFSYFVNFIIGKWYLIVNAQESERYVTDAAGAMDDVMSKIFHRKKPKRENVKCRI